MGNLKISIVVPIYNVENYIEKCVQSLLEQDYSNIEVILVDDGSPDRSGKLADALARTDERIHVIHQKNSGVSSARNAGLKSATGDYVMFVDGDDWVENNYVSYFVGMISDHNCLVGMNRNNFYVNDTFEDEKIEVVTAENAMVEIYLGSIFVAVWNKIYNLDFLKANNIFFDSSIWYGEGMLFNIMALQYVERVVVGTKPVYHQTFNTESAMRHFNLESNYCGIRSLEVQKRLWKHQSVKVNDAWNYHRYCFNRTILNGLVRTNQDMEYKTDIDNCIHALRKNIFHGIKNEKSIKQKLLWVCYALFPKMMARRYARKYNKSLQILSKLQS